MGLSKEEIAHATDLFAGINGLTTRRMFGGLGLYSNGTIFAVVMSDGTLRLKGAGDMIARFEEMGMQQWVYERPGRKATGMPYWQVPDALVDDPDGLTELAQAALTHL
jgi:DNA transformation protein